MVKKSFGQISKLAILKFVDGIPSKLSGICCHILCVLHFLIHLTETGEKLQPLLQLSSFKDGTKKGSKAKDPWQCFQSIS